MSPHATESYSTPPSPPIHAKTMTAPIPPAHQDTSCEAHLPTQPQSEDPANSQHSEPVQQQNGIAPTLQATTDTSAVSIPDPVLHTAPTASRFTVSSVLPHREAATTKFPIGVALFSSAEMFKSPIAKARPAATGDFYDSHLTREAKARQASSLKGAMKHFHPGVISLCGGLPSPLYFPFGSISAETPLAPNFTTNTSAGASSASIGKFDTTNGTSQYDLSIALNYGQSMGPPQLMRYLTEHTEIIHAPRYSNWEICLTQGSTSALDMLLRMFCERGDALLTEEYSFSSAIETALPMGIFPVGVHLDSKGLMPAHLDELLSNWESHRAHYGGANKPRLLYTVPTGQNPTGATQDLQRRRDIYALCEKHDVIILEDEPYYFLQMDPYVTGEVHSAATTAAAQPQMGTDEFVSSLVPSYLSIDTAGRVLRMDSFSKIIAPGSRCGWVTGHSALLERFVRASEVSAQNPSGFSMAVLYKLLEEQWGHQGFLEWLMFIRSEYTRRRDVIVGACEKHLPRAVCSWTDTRAGMFHWITVDGSQHAEWQAIKGLGATERDQRIKELEERIFLAGVGQDVLVARGSWFKAEKNLPAEEEAPLTNGHANGAPKEAVEVEPRLYFRMTFAAAPEQQINEAVKRFGDALKQEFGIAR